MITVKEAWDIFWWVAIFVMAIYLIENDGDAWITEIAGDLFGAIALMFIAVYNALKDDE